MGLLMDSDFEARTIAAIEHAVAQEDTPTLATKDAAVVAGPRHNGGRVDRDHSGPPPVLLLHTVEACTGRPRVSPMTYQQLSDHSVAVFATNGGAPHHPDWFHNLRAGERPVVVELPAGRTMTMRARVTHGTERETIWARQVSTLPLLADLAAATTRTIPVVVLDAVDADPASRVRA